jgi:hypothetical protein
MAYVVTDLTSMRGGNACLACLDDEHLSCVRPLFSPTAYYQSTWYEQSGINQGTKLDLKLSARPSSLPHSEDVTCSAVNIIGQIGDSAMQELLESSCHRTIVEGFGASPVAGEKHFRHDCELPARSIITLDVSTDNISLGQNKYRLGRIKAKITDDNDFTLSWIPVTDLRYVNISDEAFKTLVLSVRSASSVYIRIGLTRRYCSPQKQNGYWLQINGLYIY